MKKLLPLFLTLIAQSALALGESVIIVDEDFSGLTEGTEESPCTESLLNEYGWFKDTTLLKPYDPTCTLGWGGGNVYSAGGALAIIDGFINSPTGNYSGELSLSFRAKLLPNEPRQTAQIDILLCPRNELVDLKRETITLTKEWQTFTMEATNGYYANCMVQISTMEDTGYLIDDYKISHIITSIAPPKAIDAYNLVDDGFTAFWTPSVDAEEYLISVYSKDADGTFDYAIEDQLVPGGGEIDSCDVSGLDVNTDYFFSVKARNTDFISASSNEIEVFDVSNPIALPATDVTDSSYMAHWLCNNKVDYFRLEQVRTQQIAEDTQDYVILREDFDKVHSQWGTEEFPEPGEFTTDYQPIDQYTNTGGWIGSSLQFAEGMLGGMYPEEGYIAGCIGTPILDLSHNGGLCNVTLRVFGYEGDFLIIQGNAYMNYASIYFEQYGWVETTVQLPMCGADERIYFYSNNYYPFLIDYIQITQDLKAGDLVSFVDRTLTIDAPAREVLVDNVDLTSGTVQYRLSAFRCYHGTKEYWQSPDSELVTVGSSSTIEQVNNEVRPQSVYNLHGRRIASPEFFYIQDGKVRIVVK